MFVALIYAPMGMSPLMLLTRAAPTALRRRPPSGLSTVAYKHRFHKFFVLPYLRKIPGTEVAPVTPARQPSFPRSTSCTHQRTRRLLFNPAWRRFWTKLRPVGVGRGRFHCFDRRTPVGKPGCGGVRAQPGSGDHTSRVHLLVVFSGWVSRPRSAPNKRYPRDH